MALRKKIFFSDHYLNGRLSKKPASKTPSSKPSSVITKSALNSEEESDYGREAYRNIRKASLKPNNMITMKQVGTLMDSISKLPTPLREQAFISFFLGPKKHRKEQDQTIMRNQAA